MPIISHRSVTNFYFTRHCAHDLGLWQTLCVYLCVCTCAACAHRSIMNIFYGSLAWYSMHSAHPAKYVTVYACAAGSLSLFPWLSLFGPSSLEFRSHAFSLPSFPSRCSRFLMRLLFMEHLLMWHILKSRITTSRSWFRAYRHLVIMWRNAGILLMLCVPST